MQNGLSHFFDATVPRHFSLLQYSVIFQCYNTQPFFSTTANSFLVTTMREVARSFCKMIEIDAHGREAVCGSIASARVTYGSIAGARGRAAQGAGQTRSGSVSRSVG
jgi:hypothetical protein